MVENSKPSGKAVARGNKRMSSADVEKVRKIVSEWASEPMSWDLIREKVLIEVQIPSKSASRNGSAVEPWTRQALSGHAEIKNAFQKRKNELAAERRRNEKNPARNNDPEVVLLRRERDALRIKLSDAEAKLAHYEELFQRTVYNRFERENNAPDLLKPLPKKFDRQGRDK